MTGMLPNLVASWPCSEPDKLAKWDFFLFAMHVNVVDIEDSGHV